MKKEIGEKAMDEKMDPPGLLFVDDEENILKALKRLFKPEGYTIFTATSGPSGLEILEQEKINLVISDMRMPEMDGATFLTKTTAFWPETIRILMTGYADLDATIKAINKGQIYRYISKPWDDYDLTQVVKQALRQQHLEEVKCRFEVLIQAQNKRLHDLNKDLEIKVEERTAELREAFELLEKANESIKEQYLTSLKEAAQISEQLRDEKGKNAFLIHTLESANLELPRRFN